MSTGPLDLTDDALDAALRDLGAHLDLGAGETQVGRAALVTDVLDRVDVPRHRGRYRLLVAAALVILVLAALLAITPTREAIARWLGIGGVAITVTDETLPDGTSPAPGAPEGTTPENARAVDLEDLRRSLPFPVRVADPAVAGELRAGLVDPTVPSGLVELRYDDLTVVELASQPDGPPILAKVMGPDTTITAVTVGDRPGYWLTGDPHQIASLDPDGEVRLDTVRRAGDVLVWEDGGVTTRIEGAASLDAALSVAATLR